jgi:hypothetical protein
MAAAAGEICGPWYGWQAPVVVLRVPLSGWASVVWLARRGCGRAPGAPIAKGTEDFVQMICLQRGAEGAGGGPMAAVRQASQTGRW